MGLILRCMIALTVLALATVSGFAQDDQPKSRDCVSLKIYSDDSLLPEPYSLIVGYGPEILTVEPIDGCFQLPKNWLAKKQVQVRVDAADNTLIFGPIDTSAFDCPWNIYLSSHGKDTWIKGKRYKASTQCRIEFRKGEPGIGIVVTPCRSKRKPLPVNHS